VNPGWKPGQCSPGIYVLMIASHLTVLSQVFTYFLSTKTQAWKDKYVAGYVAMSAPLGGAAKLFRLYISGKMMKETSR